MFEPETIAAVEETIDRIEQRTKAEVVVYTQVVDYPTTEETERHALALIDQWGVGRQGFDDGLAIFFDFEPGRSSGQVQLYAAPGFAATFLTNRERQQIFENDMLPHLRADDWDAAILAGMDRIEEVATPENAARLDLGTAAERNRRARAGPDRARRDCSAGRSSRGVNSATTPCTSTRRRSTSLRRRPGSPPHLARW